MSTAQYQLVSGSCARQSVVTFVAQHWAWLAAFSLGLLSKFSVSVFGSITLAEPLAAGLLPLLVSHKLARRERWFENLHRKRLIAIATSLACATMGYMLADMYWGSPMLTSMKGIARFIVFSSNAAVLWLLLDRSRNAWIGYVVGTIFGASATTMLFRPLFNDYWKFGFAMPVSFGVLLSCALLGKRYLTFTTLLLFGLVVVHILFGSRASALTMFAFAAQRPFAYKKGFRHVGLLALAGVIAIAAVLTLSSFSARKNTSRSDVQRATHIQFCLDGIAKHPFIGNGTWYTASGYVDHFYEILYRRSRVGGTGGFEYGGPLGVSMHCQLLNAWSEGGILGAAFFFVCLGFATHDLLFRSVDPTNPAHEIRDMMMIQCLMALALSTFGGLSRWPLAFQLWFILDLGQKNSRATEIVESGRSVFLRQPNI